MDRCYHGGTTRRTILGAILTGSLSVLGGCNWDGHFDILGYTTRPNFNPQYRTIYVPPFRNKALQWNPYRNMEMELTRALIREIEMTTPMKVVSDPRRADTELLGTVTMLSKTLINRNQQNEVREGEVDIGVEIVWRDLNTNKILSNPPKPIGPMGPNEIPVFDVDNPPRPDQPDVPIPVFLSFGGRYLPEVGESNATALQRVCNRTARQIVNMMEVNASRPVRPAPGP